MSLGLSAAAWAAIGTIGTVGVSAYAASRDKGGGVGGSESSAENKTAVTPEQEAALKELIAKLTGRNSATTPYRGQLSATIQPNQRTSLAALEKQALEPDTGFGSTEDARQTLSKFMHDDASDIGDYFEKSVANPEAKRFQERTLPALFGSFRGNSAFGSDLRAAEMKATQDYNDTVVGKRSEMAFNARESAKNRALQAAGILPGFDSARADMLYKLYGAQSGIHDLEQQELDRQYQEFQRQQGGEQTNINQILAALGLNTVNTVVTPGQPGFLTAAAPGFGQAAGQYLMQYLTRNRSSIPSGGGAYYGGGSAGDPGGNWDSPG